MADGTTDSRKFSGLQATGASGNGAEIWIAANGKAPCTHRYIRARQLLNGRWRAYCADGPGVAGCGKWMRDIDPAGLELDKVQRSAVLKSFNSDT